MRLVLLGTAGGPAWYDRRQGIASAVEVDGNVYLVDCGEGVGRQYARAGFAPFEGRHTLRGLRAIFLTHLHSDHCVDFFNVWLFSWFNGIDKNPHVVQAHGPGVVAMTEQLTDAFAPDIEDRMRASRQPPFAELFEAHDIDLPAEVVAAAEEDPAPEMDPIDVYEDEHVRVSAILVPHPPMFPSFAFRFDGEAGSIAFSGDTRVTPNLEKLARGADVLVHEVIDRAWVESRYEPPLDPVQQASVDHLLSSHTTIEEVGAVAERCGAGTLVLNHFVPADNPPERWLEAQAGFSGRLVVGEDLMQISLT